MLTSVWPPRTVVDGKLIIDTFSCCSYSLCRPAFSHDVQKNYPVQSSNVEHILTSKLGHDWTSKLRTNCHNFQMLYRCPELVTNQPNINMIVYLTSVQCKRVNQTILGSGLNSSRANQSSTKTISMWHSRSRQNLYTTIWIRVLSTLCTVDHLTWEIKWIFTSVWR